MPATTSGAARRGARPGPGRLLAAGAVLAAGAATTMLLSEALDLGLESVVLMGAALGAVLALVPDATPGRRLGAAAAGFAVAFIGYVARAAYLPDSATGRALAVALVVMLCVAVAAATAQRLPLWAVLLGTVGLTGAYELTYAAAPPRLLETSVSTGTALALNVALGFALAVLAGPAAGPRRPSPEAPARENENVTLDTMMETPA